MTDASGLLPLTEAFYCILITLWPEPSHGYGMMQAIEKMTEGRVRIGAGTLYTALSTLLGKGLIENAPAPDSADARRKMYAITSKGKQVVMAEMKRLEELVVNGRNLTNSMSVQSGTPFKKGLPLLDHPRQGFVHPLCAPD